VKGSGLSYPLVEGTGKWIEFSRDSRQEQAESGYVGDEEGDSRLRRTGNHGLGVMGSDDVNV